MGKNTVSNAAGVVKKQIVRDAGNYTGNNEIMLQPEQNGCDNE